MTLPSRDRRLRAIALAAYCSVLLAGCAAGPVDVPPATGVPVAAPAVDPAVERDWTAAAYRALDCVTRAEWTAQGLPAGAWDASGVRATSADVTGDGVAEVLVQAACPTPASTPAERVVVLAVSGRAPALLGVLGDELFLTSATVTTAGTTVTLSGPTVAGEDPTCCPGHHGTVTYAWDAARFVVAARSEEPGRDTATDGVHVGLLRSAESLHIP